MKMFSRAPSFASPIVRIPWSYGGNVIDNAAQVDREVEDVYPDRTDVNVDLVRVGCS
jgi:hypothetical protein